MRSILVARTSDCKCKSRNKSWVRSHHPPTQWNLTGRQMKQCWKMYFKNTTPKIIELTFRSCVWVMRRPWCMSFRYCDSDWKQRRKGKTKPMLEIIANIWYPYFKDCVFCGQDRCSGSGSGWSCIIIEDPDPVWHPGARRSGSGFLSVSTKCKAYWHWRKNT
jgi:hypothetical protein